MSSDDTRKIITDFALKHNNKWFAHFKKIGKKDFSKYWNVTIPLPNIANIQNFNHALNSAKTIYNEIIIATINHNEMSTILISLLSWNYVYSWIK